jgi:hypothetical protein
VFQVVQSCIGTKYTSRFGTLMAVSDQQRLRVWTEGY